MFFRVTLFGVLLVSCLIAFPSTAQDNIAAGSMVTSGMGDLSGIDVASINGTVTTQEGRPVADARVEVHSVSTGAIVASGFTGPNGSFSLRNIQRAPYEIVATSGISETRERVQLSGVDASVSLRLPHMDDAEASGQASVSVSQLRVPDKAKNELAKARKAGKKRNVDDSLEHVEKALAIAPRYADALVFRAFMKLAKNNTAGAADDLHQAIQCDPSSAIAYIGMGSIYNSQSKFDEALREVERGVALNPTAWQGYFERARARLGKGDFETALADVRRAEELVPQGFAPIHLLKGHALLGLKDYTAAVAEFETFLNKDGGGPDTVAAQRELQEAKAFVATAGK